MEVISSLQELTGKKHVILCESGDHAIRTVMRLAKNKGLSKAFIPDQGGWLTYKDYAKKQGLQVVELKTDSGVINPEALAVDASGFLMLNSLAAYAFEQPMKEISEASKNVLLANDISGSIGRKHLMLGDVLLCSFGTDKPVNANYGGCLATNDDVVAKFLSKHSSFDKTKLLVVEKALKALPARLKMFEQARDKIKQDLAKHDIVHKEHAGINVIVKYANNAEKNVITNYCQQNNYSFTECPRYIRVLEPAICVEVKKL